MIRTYISFPAGFAKYPVVPFSLLTLVGALPWCIALGLLGYDLGNHASSVSSVLTKIGVVVAVVIVALVARWWWHGRALRTASPK